MKIRSYRLISIIVFCILAGGLLAYGYRIWLTAGRDKKYGPTPGELTGKLAKVRTHLYFLDEHHQFLKAEERTLARQDSVVDHSRSIVQALINGPDGELLPTLPPEAKLISVFLTEDGVAYLDFDGAIRNKHPGGGLSELLTIFSVVNTLTLNVSEVEAVKILIEGHEANTLAGHVDIRFPFKPDILMIK